MRNVNVFGLSLLVYFSALFILSLGSNDDGWSTVDGLAYSLMRHKNLETHNTKQFRRGQGLHVRHGLDLTVSLRPLQWNDADKPYKFGLVDNEDDEARVYTWVQTPEIQDETLYFHLFINWSIPVGSYKLEVSHDDPHAAKDTRLGDVSIIFNPWNVQGNDFQSRVQRQETPNFEYLMNDYSYIWGSDSAYPWDYGTRSQVVVEAKNALMGYMTQEERSSTVQYSRALTRVINSVVLIGRWNGNYDDGYPPWSWIGSEAILQNWLQTRQPVRYGQCWVFAGVLTTLLRVSGIPARTVTNIGSHHNRGLTNDRTAVLRQYDGIKQDDESCWNFHVWSEAWMDRPDLGMQGEPQGWNAVDATPQEPSPLAPGQPYRIGPAYVPYIRDNFVTEDYDTFFISAEVNARDFCRITGQELPNYAGQYVLTKRIGTDPNNYNYLNPDIITDTYKIATTLQKTAADSTAPSFPPPYVGCEREGGMCLNSTPSSPTIGEEFTLTVSEGNVSTADTVINMELRNYMGESLEFIKTFTGMKELVITESTYRPYLRNSSIFRFSVGTYNESGAFVFHDALIITLVYDAIDVQDETDPNSSNITLTLNFVNPLSVPMTEVLLSYTAPNGNTTMLSQPDISSGEQFMATIEVECDGEEGDVMIAVVLDSDEMQSARGMGMSTCSDTDDDSGDMALY